jgi:type II secretory ATPase GspE/PulE/Tfp pilus assembly ATPase PilB-like protein/rubrerythrin
MPTSKEKDLIILDLYEAHELAMYEIYNLFTLKYIDYEDFWRGLAEEEKVHARWIRTIRAEIENGSLSLAADVVSISTLENSLGYLQNMIKEFSSQDNTVDKAFAFAMKIENSVIEKGIFNVVQNSSEPVKKTLLNLTEKTGMHYQRIRDMARKRTRLHGLVDAGIIRAEDLEFASATAIKEGESIEAVIMKTFKVPKKTILEIISAFCDMSYWSFDPRNPAFPAGLSQALAGKYQALKSELFVPVEAQGRKIIIAIANPTDIMKREYIKKFFPVNDLEFRVGLSDDIAAAVDAFFGVSNAAVKGKSMDDILHEMKSGTVENEIKEEDQEPEIYENDNIVVQLVNNIIGDAAKLNASDIHIEPSLEGDVHVRYRIDGMMSRAHVFPRKFRNAVSSRIKVMAGLDIAERRKPQSGKIRFKRWGPRDFELRVETYSTTTGSEDVVMRLLSLAKPRPLEELDFTRRNLEEFIRLINMPYGIILCVGPTGSGKTTTLHSALKYLNKEDTKILTAEDPVEITQEGLRQIQVNPRANITFASSMRSFLRADPDVIMIGEMRDMETSSTAIEASLTGHLVLSTLHTNSAPETVVRLVEMGIDRYSFADSLLGILAQRLVRTLCPNCKKEMTLNDEEIDIFRQEYNSPDLFDTLLSSYGSTVYIADENGCEECRGTGYKGRIAIHELLMVTGNIKEAIYRKANASEIKSIAVEEGMTLLRQDGIEKVFSGKTTIAEILAATNR